MRVIRTKKRHSSSKLVILSLGLTSVALLIGGLVTGQVILIGAGAAGLFLTGGAFIGLRKPDRTGLV
jgi:hypothetical protein